MIRVLLFVCFFISLNIDDITNDFSLLKKYKAFQKNCIVLIKASVENKR